MKKNQNASLQIESTSSEIPPKSVTKEIWLETETLTIAFNPYNFSILVTEQPPLPNRIAFCGGGARIPAHIGAYEELNKRGLKFQEFSGSSAGALVATFAYLGYSIKDMYEIISWFDEDKLLDNPVQISLSNIQKIFSKGGLSSAKSMHQAANFVILKKVMEIISDDKYKHRFADHQAFLKKNVFDCPSCITFETLATIKKICPECDLGDKLFILGTDLSAKQLELFSAETTPAMGIADANVISANLPVAYERIIYNGKVYSDGGITKNYPVDCFPRNESQKMFLKHNSDADYTVIGLQFDNGPEFGALYSEKPIHQWSWLSSQLYALITGHPNTTDNWHKDLQQLRLHAHQSILIQTPKVGVTRLTLDEDVHAQVVECGKKAARDYLDHHGYYIDSQGQTLRNEWMYKTFHHPEELLEYCRESRQLDVVKQLQIAIAASAHLEKGYRQYLLEQCNDILSDEMSLLKKEEAVETSASQINEVCELEKEHGLEVCQTFSFFGASLDDKKLITDNQTDLKIHLFTKLYPIFMQNWQKLCPISGIADIINTMRTSLLAVDSAHRCVKLLINKLKEINSGHFLVFLFKLALKHYEQSNFDFLLKNLKYLHKSLSLIEKKQLHGNDRFYGNWDFDDQDPKMILQCLKNDDMTSLLNILDIKKAPLGITLFREGVPENG